jgi:hypothetical protein
MKTVIRTNASVCATLCVILVGSVCADSAQPPNGIELNAIAFTFAAKRIKERRVVTDGKGAWTRHRPSTDEENEFIRLHGFAQYAKWHLGIDRRFPENSKRRYKFPYGDFKNVHRCGLLAVKARARQFGYAEIENAAVALERTMKNSATD